MTRQSRTKAFRKTDIATLESNLHEAALQKTLTGGVISQTANADLFVVDTQGQTGPHGGSRQQKALRLDEIVRPKSKINVPAQKKAGKLDEALVKRRLQAAMKTAGKGPSAPLKKSVKTEKIVDPWAASSADVPISKINRSTVTRAKAIALPHAGSSYNPEPVAHGELMEAAAEQELARLERIERAKKAVDIPRAPRPDVLNYDETTGMIYEDIFGPAQSESEADEAQAEEDMSMEAPLAKKRKSKADKRRDIELIASEEGKKQDRLAKIVDSQALHARSLLRTVRQESAAKRQSLAARTQARTTRNASLQGRKLGPMRYVLPMMAVKLPEEISGSLRELKPEGNLIEDRFKSLQAQAKIEPRVRRAAGRRRYELKSYEKHSYKNFV